MGRTLRWYINFNLAIGLGNLHYDPRLGRFELYHTPTLVYCLLLNVVYLLLLPSAFALLVNSFYQCLLAMLATVFNIIALAQLSSSILLICGIWLRRRIMCRSFNRFASLLRKYRERMSEADGVELTRAWRRCLFKLVMDSGRFAVLLHQLFIQNCGLVTPIYVISGLFMVLMELLVSGLEFNIYIGATMGNMLLILMRQEMLEMVRDSQLLPERRCCYRDIWEQQLLAAWCRLWRSCLRLDNLLIEMLRNLQWQVFFNLFSSYLSGTVLLFRLLVYADYDEEFDIQKFIMFSLFCVVIYLEIVMRFSIFEENHRHRLLLLDSINQLRFTLPPQGRSKAGLVLDRQLEFAVLLMNRKLQREPQRTRHLHILGFFDMSRLTGYNMFSSMVGNTLILCQIAIKKYYILSTDEEDYEE